MKRLLALMAASSLAGCGIWSSTIKTEIANYDNVIEETTDELLLINILEARDKAPLHFGEIPKVNGSLQANASVATAIPFVDSVINHSAFTGSAVQGSITPTITAQSAPSFEVDNLDTQDFVVGMSSPLDPKFVKYWVDRGIDSRLLMFLFVSSIHLEDKSYQPYDKPGSAPIDAEISIDNTPRETADAMIDCLSRTHPAPDWCHSREDFEFFLKFVNGAVGTKDITANAYTERSRLKKDIPLSADEIAQFDSPQYKIELSGKDVYDIYAADDTKKVAICFENIPANIDTNHSPSTISVGTAPGGDVCTDSTIVDDVPSPPTNPPIAIPAPDENGSTTLEPAPCPHNGSPTSEYCDLFRQFINTIETNRHDSATNRSSLLANKKYTVSVNVRSVAEIVHFLGDILYYQNVMSSYYRNAMSKDVHHQIPVTLGYICPPPRSDPEPGCLSDDGGVLFQVNAASGTPRFKVYYRGDDYSVAEYSQNDHSLEVIAIVNQLMDLNKKATDIRATPLVQVVP
jgi:hypothetical protein